jgi:hypothetical protein
MVHVKAKEAFLRDLVLATGCRFLVTGCGKKESLAQRRRLLDESLFSY